MFAMLILTLAPYTGPVQRGGLPGTSKFGLSVSGPAAATIDLRAKGVPAGYVASFCTNRICSPFRITLKLPPSGRSLVEFQLARSEPRAHEPPYVTVMAATGEFAKLAFSLGTR